MPTTVTNTIGTGKTYTTLAAWEADCPANLVTDDKIWRGEAYKTPEYTAASTVLTISGITADTTRYVELTAAAGESFQDTLAADSPRGTTELAYNASNGVGVRVTGSWAAAPIVSQVNHTRISRLQCNGNWDRAIDSSGGYITNCLLHYTSTNAALKIASNKVVVANCVIFCSDTAAQGIYIDAVAGCEVIGCTIVRSTAVATGGLGVGANYVTGSNTIVQSCALFGWTTPIGVIAGSSPYDTTNTKNNGTQAATCTGSSNQTSITYSDTAPFKQAGTSGTDLETDTGNALAANGYRHADYQNDVTATARADPPTIGAWELVSAPPPGTWPGGFIGAGYF